MHVCGSFWVNKYQTGGNYKPQNTDFLKNNLCKLEYVIAIHHKRNGWCMINAQQQHTIIYLIIQQIEYLKYTPCATMVSGAARHFR